jgi:hypothetical protein
MTLSKFIYQVSSDLLYTKQSQSQLISHLSNQTQPETKEPTAEVPVVRANRVGTAHYIGFGYLSDKY